jgi:para-nitrobenzyl esterase
MKAIVAVVVLASSACGTDSADGNPTNGSDNGSAGSAGSAVSPPSACAVGSSTDPLVVATDKGLVKGTQAGTRFAFLGIPFAAPPVGSLRFRPPQPAACWSDVIDASQFGNTCAQYNPFAGGIEGSEDCLTINVWTPALPSSSGTPLPVLFWVFGGGDILGGSSQPGTAGQELANAHHAVVVSFNYRVGPLGFLAHPALRDATPEHTTGNNGLLDAIAALHWVQDNIAVFGGDPKRVMLFGQSAGAINTCSLVASPLTHGLFSSALMESGNCAAETLSYRYSRGELVTAAAGCALANDVVGCLQNASLDSILNTGAGTFVGSFVTNLLTTSTDGAHVEDLPFAPTIDGYVLDDTPEATIRAGKHNHVPLVIGTNAREGADIIPQNLFPQLPIVDCAEYATVLTSIFPGIAIQLLQAYPCNALDATAGYRQAVAVLTDAFFTCSSRRALRAASAAQSEPVYRYVFSHGRAGHGDETPYVFGSATGATPDETTLSQRMQSYWVNFAATGNPNGADLPTWSAYVPDADNALRLDIPIGNVAELGASGCAFWDTVQ